MPFLIFDIRIIFTRQKDKKRQNDIKTNKDRIIKKRQKDKKTNKDKIIKKTEGQKETEGHKDK